MKTAQSRVVDQNYLREPNQDLHNYLSSGNFAVLTDYATMEVYKGDSLLNIRRSLEILSKYPLQVVVLKPTPTIIRITQGGSKVLRGLLIDNEQTADFGDFCEAIYRLDRNRLSPDLAMFESKSRQSNEFYAKRLEFAQMVLEAVGTYESAFSPEQLKHIRTGKPYTHELLEMMMDQIFSIAIRLMKLNEFSLPNPRRARNNYLFRWAVSGYLFMIKWLSEGGYQSLPVEKMQNDIIDVTYAAYATYFDGLLSKDKKMNEVHTLTKAFLKYLGT